VDRSVNLLFFERQILLKFWFFGLIDSNLLQDHHWQSISVLDETSAGHTYRFASRKVLASIAQMLTTSNMTMSFVLILNRLNTAVTAVY